ncbi:uncharacterized protein [Parasteatoda tepidariorum]|nr:uncharacterized protein LOC107451452 isoform X2 [Parasteatoda tepidariorum]XP_015923053.1 uncharacterized protein LOC107451452 isoform X2 [Parasteatoda tepidariorum]
MSTMINLGDRFESFSSFEKSLEIFETETNTRFCIAESKTLENTKQRYPRCERAPQMLKYYSIRYKCMHGGVFRKSKQSRGLRSSSTLKIGCQAFIHLFLSDDVTSLVVKALNLEHNHDTSEAIFIEVPTHRKRNSKLRVQVTESNAKKRKKIRQENIPQDTVNVAHLQDLTNLNASNSQIYLTPNGTDCEAPYGLAPDEAVCESADGSEINHNPAVTEVEVESSEHKLCRCGIGTFDLTNQDLMKMEVEEHYHRLEVLQLQKAYETERIEKMRHLYDLKIRLAEQELQNSNF